MKLPHHLDDPDGKKDKCRRFFSKKSSCCRLLQVLALIAFHILLLCAYKYYYFHQPLKKVEDIAKPKPIITQRTLPELYYTDDEDKIPYPPSIDKQNSYNYKSRVEYVPDVLLDIIEDPENYTNQPPERPLLPRNFYQKLSGVHNLEISTGVIVLHNYSGIPSSRIFKFAGHQLNVTTFDSGHVKEHFVWLPPFEWKLPQGLTDLQTQLFWRQPENHWHFDDCKMWSLNVVWEVKNGVSSLCDKQKCQNHNYTHHLNFCEWPTTTETPHHKGNVFVFGDHYIEIFQHFFDNGIPHLAAMSFATGLHPDQVKSVTTACNSITLQVMDKLGFRNRHSCSNMREHVSAENLIMIPSMRVLHPYYYDWYRELMNVSSYGFDSQNNPIERNKIVILPRGVSGGGGGNARIIYNIDEIKSSLEEIHGVGNVLIPDRSLSLETLFNYYSKVKVILGPHGGAFYNHFFAQKGIEVIEMIPMMSTGMYPLQRYWNREIPFAHLAFLSNVQLMSQKFWRYISMDAPINYYVNVSDFIDWTNQIPSLQNKTNHF
ncbi:hypothetical protein TRFO_30398 [Tritrichomonas foetus]|uniref:Glycosyltransferase 61 catalytic domain-containing protein n=1 Tax=Tritrichomonas foetus TaxID=1144522 RepID=A0A1J4JTK6_9EUKA|nr:hypothetical protein TRFO_30398 [Tritrichomonas foetus]|eukprot:OHT02457.1 hypothetical protein TRFO_30398 [Tritrichomonas foetus]